MCVYVCYETFKCCWNKLGLPWWCRSRLPHPHHYSPHLQVRLASLILSHSLQRFQTASPMEWSQVSFPTWCSTEFLSSFARFQREGSSPMIMRARKDGSFLLVAFYHYGFASYWGVRRREIIVRISRHGRLRARGPSLTVCLKRPLRKIQYEAGRVYLSPCA